MSYNTIKVWFFIDNFFICVVCFVISVTLYPLKTLFIFYHYLEYVLHNICTFYCCIIFFNWLLHPPSIITLTKFRFNFNFFKSVFACYYIVGSVCTKVIQMVFKYHRGICGNYQVITFFYHGDGNLPLHMENLENSCYPQLFLNIYDLEKY